MKLSNHTVKVLKNFSSINQGIVVKPGKVLRTISSNKALLAEATVDEKFDKEFGIYDLNKTLSLLSLSEENEVDIKEEYLQFKGLSEGYIRQRFTPSNLILCPPNKNIEIEDFAAQVELTEETLNWIFNVANILKCPNIVIRKVGKKCQVAAEDAKGVIVDDASCFIPGESAGNFEVTLKIENLKLIPDSYTVQIASAGVCKFTNKDDSVVYWVAIEKNHSKIGE